VIAAQAKRYFEELYHLGTSVLRRSVPPTVGAGPDGAQSQDPNQ
jgi:hypothetical protein